MADHMPSRTTIDSFLERRLGSGLGSVAGNSRDDGGDTHAAAGGEGIADDQRVGVVGGIDPDC